MSLSEFLNRLVKMDKHYGKWARRQGISCYRIYSKDLKDFPYLIDRYEGYVHIASAFSHSLPSDEEKNQEVLDHVPKALGLRPEKVILKHRQRQRGTDQYQKQDHRGQRIVVQEGGLKFYVNLFDYMDTGLFLDHRISRNLIRERSLGARVLNLFCYTGSFSVYAAHGGAIQVTSLDLSHTYLDWARENLELNNLHQPLHRFIQEDALTWLEAQSKSAQFDLIILDPPTFSNSKKMEGVLDVQRDHKKLIQLCLRILQPGGLLFFSNNYKKFKMDPSLEEELSIKCITPQTLPKDFRQGIHQSFWISAQKQGKKEGSSYV